MFNDTLEERKKSAFPLSIGTSLIFETIFETEDVTYDPNWKPPQHTDINSYTHLWINVKTLYRNMFSSLDRVAAIKIFPEDYVSELYNEMTVITELMSKTSCKPVFYIPEYNSILKRISTFKNVRFRDPSTPNQIQQRQLQEKIFKLFRNDKNPQVPLLVFENNDIIPQEQLTKALFITNYPQDLLYRRKFAVMDLIESNTGTLKKLDKWYTKFEKIPGSELKTIPFTKKMLYIFGDSVQYRPMLIALRRLVLDVSIRKGWTAYTTEDKINFDLNNEIKDEFVKAVLQELK